MNNNIKRLIPRAKQIELKTNSDVSDYFYLTLVLGVGLFLSILIFVVSASYQYREAQQQFEGNVVTVHSALSANAARQTLEFEFLAKSILDARHDASLKKSDWVRRRISESDFTCVLLVGPRRSVYDSVLKGGTVCGTRSPMTRGLVAKYMAEKMPQGQEFQSQLYSDPRGGLYVGLIAPLNYPINQFLLAIFPVDSLFPKTLGKVEEGLFQTHDGIDGSFGKKTIHSSTGVLQRRVRIAGQDIPLFYAPSSGQYDVKLGWPWTILALGLAITSLLGVMIFNLIGKNMDVQKEVERKTADLQIATSEAVRANQTKTRFLANVSHEVRTPLNLILGMADLLMETPLNQEQKRYVSTFKKSGTHLLEIINDILDVASIEVNEGSLEMGPMDLIELTEGISDFVSVACRNKKIGFDYEISDDLPRMIDSSPKRLRQILINLINNAMKFTDRGQILLSISKEKTADGDFLTFRVKDTGIGIPKDQLDKVYESFYQIDSSSKRGKGGVGLGLHIVKTCVEQMSGTIQLESEIGIGTTFWVRLPLKTQSNQSWIDELTVKHAAKKSEQVFLLTPNSAQGNFLKNCLEKMGYVVQSHSFGHNALKNSIGQRKSYDFYLIDLIGQDMGGLEFLGLASLPKEDLKKVIVLCPLVHRSGDFQAMKNLGVERICNTPVKFKSLLQCFREIREGHEGHFDVITVAEKSTTAPPVIMKKKIRLLVAEDDEDNRFLIQAYLDSYGMEICFAENGLVALEQFKAKESKFDLIITDIQMPRMDGFELIQEIRQWESSKKLRKLPIIALTADAQPEQVENVRKLGGNEYLKKPISKNDLLATILRYQTFPTSSTG